MTTREKILNTSAELFFEKGFSATTVREIAGKVGIEAASLYNHISSKSQLLEQICFETATRFEQNMADIMSRQSSSIDKIESLLDFHLDIAIKDPKVLMVFSQEWRHLDKDEQRRFQALKKAYEENFNSILKQGQKENRINKALDSTILVKSILSSLQWVYFLKKSSAKKYGAEIRQNIKHLIKNGVTN